MADDFLTRSENPVDLVFIDLPGTVNISGILKTIMNVDYLFVPIVPDRIVMQSSLSFSTTIRDYIEKNPEVQLKGLFLFWNRLDRRASQDTFEIYCKIIEKLETPVLETLIYESRRFDRELSPVGKPFFRSTLFPAPAKLLRGCNIIELSAEILRTINL